MLAVLILGLMHLFCTQEGPKDLETPPYLDPGHDRRTLQISVERSVQYGTESESDIFGESSKK